MSEIASTITTSSSPGFGYYQPERKTESDRIICQACPYGRMLDNSRIYCELNPSEPAILFRDMRQKYCPLLKWIPCEKKKLPETPIRVQVQLDNGWIITAYYDEGKWYAVPDWDGPLEGVLAWRALPEPYEEVPK